VPESPRLASDDPKDLIRRAGDLLADAEAIVKLARDGGDSRLALTAIRETRSSLELLLKVNGLLGPDTVTLIDQSKNMDLSGFTLADFRAIVAASATEKNHFVLSGADDHDG
jgi:hypothetical protein